jgi:hypothetical protein
MRAAPLLPLVLCLASCALGKESILFTTKTSFAIDVDSKPPTFDLGYARKEGALAPVVESGEVLPLMTGFGADAGLIDAVFGRIGAQFALGQAAVLTSKFLDSDAKLEVGDAALESMVESETAGTVVGTLEATRRYFFGTDTVLGFRVNMTPETGNIPDSVTLGWRRKEFAYVPITEIQLPSEDEPRLRIPSLIATAGADTSAGKTIGARVSSFYATGEAATYLAAVPFVRKYVTERVSMDSQLGSAIDESEIKREARQEELNAARKGGATLKSAADALIDRLDAADLDVARTEVIEAGLIDPVETFEDSDGDGTVSEEEQRAWLKRKTNIFNDPELVPVLEDTVRRLAALAER